MIHLLVFVAAALVDALWVLWHSYVAQRRAALAALTSGALAALGLLSTREAFLSWEYVPAYTAGLMLGTLGTVLWEKRRDRKRRARLGDLVLKRLDS
jgi:hypothetical protein